MSGSISLNIPLCGDLLEANNRVAKSNGSDVGGTWLQLMCCALPKHLSLIYLRGLGAENVGGGWSWVGGVVLELDGGRLSQVVVRMKANED